MKKEYNEAGDGRFEIIAKAKEHLLEATNIDTSPDEMKVIDGFLFRCWQMGWLNMSIKELKKELKKRARQVSCCIKCKHWCDGCYQDKDIPCKYDVAVEVIEEIENDL